jgi:hypothetical protein
MDVDIDEIDVNIEVEDGSELPDEMGTEEVAELEKRMSCIYYQKLVLCQ